MGEIFEPASESTPPAEPTPAPQDAPAPVVEVPTPEPQPAPEPQPEPAPAPTPEPEPVVAPAASGLHWTGIGFFDGVPARDLTAEEAATFDTALLLASGCYTPA